MDQKPPDDRAARVNASFDELDAQVGSRLDDASRAAMERVRAAAAGGDHEALKQHVGALRQEHGWLYRELAAHPQIANWLDELALLGL
jgi:hypothetical protein